MVSNEVKEPQVQVGSRVACDGEYGTVKYIGEIESQQGVWIGVEWDNPARGKHSGSYKGVTYFETSIPDAGSFVRPWKIETGISCPEAVRRKYGEEEEEDDLAPVFNLPQNSGRVRTVEMVGFQKVAKKQSQFHKLTEIVVSMMCVSEPGGAGEMGELVPSTVSLDLACNLLPSWSPIAVITEQLPHLRCLVLSKNRLKIESCMDRFKEAFSTVTTMVLNDVAYTWNDILDCAIAWPYVEVLYVSNNKIVQLEVPPYPVFTKLRYLSLEGNLVCSWEEICKLGQLQNLEELYLDNALLESISFANVPPMEKTNLFPKLAALSVPNNRLARWQDISELNKLKNLKDLRCGNNPVMTSVSPETARQLVIAKISGLEKLNRTEITRSERRGAEIDYIKRFHSEWFAHGGHKDLNASNPSMEFLTEHPTYIAILKKHGGAEDAEVAKWNPLLKNNLISIEIFSLQQPNKPPIKKRLPVTMPLCKVKGLLQRLFRVPGQDMKIIHHSCNGGIRTEMDNDFRELAFYSVSDGDKIEAQW